MKKKVGSKDRPPLRRQGTVLETSNKSDENPFRRLQPLGGLGLQDSCRRDDQMLPGIWIWPGPEARVERRVGFRGGVLAMRLEEGCLPEPRQVGKWPFPMSPVDGVEPIIMNGEAVQNPHTMLDDPWEEGVTHLNFLLPFIESGNDCYPNVPHFHEGWLVEARHSAVALRRSRGRNSRGEGTNLRSARSR